MKESMLRWGLGARAVWCVVALATAAACVDVVSSHVLGMGTAEGLLCTLCISALQACVLASLYQLALHHRLLRILIITVVAGLVFLGLFNICAYRFYGTGISRRLLVIIAQTNPQEAKEFLPGLMGNLRSAVFYLPTLWVLTGAILLWIAIRKIPGRVWAYGAYIAGGIGLIYYGWFCAHYPVGKTAFFLYLRTAKYAIETYRSTGTSEALEKLKRPFPDAGKVESSHLTPTIVFVLGESASRSHWSLYGYPLPTTRAMDSLRDSLFIFTDAKASSSSTAGNMERILTFKEDDSTFGDWYRFPTLVEMMNLAGYRTSWLSNQERSGLMSNSTAVLTEAASRTVFLSESSEDALIRQYDEALLPYFLEELADTADYKLIMLHLMGSHTLYSHRYPAGREKFTATDIENTTRLYMPDHDKASVVAEYDNSIAYTDSILGEIAQSISSLTSPAIMIYFSDHGEEVYDYRDFLGRSRKAVDVPFIAYPNAAFRAANPELCERLSDASSKAISTANFIYMIMSLTGTRYPLYNASKNPLDSGYLVQPRMIDEEPE